jgi:hypothetical protein
MKHLTRREAAIVLLGLSVAPAVGQVPQVRRKPDRAESRRPIHRSHGYRAFIDAALAESAKGWCRKDVSLPPRCALNVRPCHAGLELAGTCGSKKPSEGTNHIRKCGVQ